MKKISEYLNDHGSTEEVKKEILSNATISKLIKDNNISDEEVENKLAELYRFVNENPRCRKCPSLDDCSMDVRGYKPVLRAVKGKLIVDYVQCDYFAEEYAKMRKTGKLTSILLPEEDLEFDPTAERGPIIEYLNDFILSNEFLKGIYLHGKPGTGKTLILKVATNKISNSKKCVYVDYPDFVREVKSSIGNDDTESKVFTLKETDCVVFDNFGDEGIGSDWYRDEVLMPILEYRLQKQKPMFFGSNYSKKMLEKMFLDKVRNEVKVQKLLDRIFSLSKEFELKGKNYRD